MCPWTYQTSLNLTSLVFKMRMMVMVMPSLYGSTWLITGSNVFNKWPLSAYPVQVPPSPWSHKGTLSSGSWPLPPHLNVGIRRLDGVSCPLDTPSFVMKSKDEMFPRTFPCIRRGGGLEGNHHQLLWASKSQPVRPASRSGRRTSAHLVLLSPGPSTEQGLANIYRVTS